MSAMQYEAVHLRGARYAVKPVGKLGTMGWTPRPWTVVFVNARSSAGSIAQGRERAR
jgi:hypothetical protein